MRSLDILFFISAFISFVMIIGGLFLLFKKVINLEKSADKSAAELQFKELKLSTTYPALGIFVLALTPLLISLMLAWADRDKYEIKGKIKEVDNFENVSVAVELANWDGGADSEGRVEGTIIPDRLNIRIICPGYEERIKIVNTRWSFFRSIKLGEIALKKVVQKPTKVSKIVSPTMPLPSRSQGGVF